MSRSRGDYALLWANGATFREVYDLMKADIVEELRQEKLIAEAVAEGCPPPCGGCWQCPECGTCVCEKPIIYVLNEETPSADA